MRVNQSLAGNLTALVAYGGAAVLSGGAVGKAGFARSAAELGTLGWNAHLSKISHVDPKCGDYLKRCTGNVVAQFDNLELLADASISARERADFDRLDKELPPLLCRVWPDASGMAQLLYREGGLAEHVVGALGMMDDDLARHVVESPFLRSVTTELLERARVEVLSDPSAFEKLNGAIQIWQQSMLADINAGVTKANAGIMNVQAGIADNTAGIANANALLQMLVANTSGNPLEDIPPDTVALIVDVMERNASQGQPPDRTLRALGEIIKRLKSRTGMGELTLRAELQEVFDAEEEARFPDKDFKAERAKAFRKGVRALTRDAYDEALPEFLWLEQDIKRRQRDVLRLEGSNWAKRSLARTLVHLRQIYEAQGDTDAEIATLTEAIALNPFDTAFLDRQHRRLGFAWFHRFSAEMDPASAWGVFDAFIYNIETLPGKPSEMPFEALMLHVDNYYQAQKVLSIMKAHGVPPSLFVLNHMILHAKTNTEALRHYDEIVDSPDLKPNGYTFGYTLKTLATTDRRSAERVFHNFRVSDVEPNIHLQRIMVRDADTFETSKQVFSYFVWLTEEYGKPELADLPKDAITHNLILCKATTPAQADSYLKTMADAGVRPFAKSKAHIIGICASFEQAAERVDALRRGGVRISAIRKLAEKVESVAHAEHVITLLGGRGKLDSAMAARLIERTGDAEWGFGLTKEMLKLGLPIDAGVKARLVAACKDYESAVAMVDKLADITGANTLKDEVVELMRFFDTHQERIEVANAHFRNPKSYAGKDEYQFAMSVFPIDAGPDELMKTIADLPRVGGKWESVAPLIRAWFSQSLTSEDVSQRTALEKALHVAVRVPYLAASQRVFRLAQDATRLKLEQMDPEEVDDYDIHYAGGFVALAARDAELAYSEFIKAKGRLDHVSVPETKYGRGLSIDKELKRLEFLKRWDTDQHP